MEQNFSEQESLKLIDEMIHKARQSYITRGIALMVWGVLIIVCSLLTWAQVKFRFSTGFDVWLLVFLAVIPHVYFAIKERKHRKFVGHDEQIMIYVWTTFGVCIFLLSFYNANFGNQHSTTLFFILYGVPTFITGGVFKFKPMIFGGIICWLFSIVSVYTSFSVDMLMMAASGLVAWLIPGIILWENYKKEKGNNV
jgi:hypothetical protein